MSRSRFLSLLRFGLPARGFLDQSAGQATKLFHARFQLALARGACGNVFGGFAQAGFERSGLSAERGDGFALRCDSRGEIGSLAHGLFDFERELRCAGFELSDLLEIEGDAIFGAVKIESGLAEQVLRLAKLGIEIIGARAQAFLFGFKLVHGARFALLGGVHIAEKFFQARGFDIEMLRAAGEHDAQQAAHLFAQLGVAPRLGCLALERSELLFDFDENVVDARKIDLRGFELGFREALFGLVHRDAGGFFDDRAAIHGLRIQDLADAALLDDGVAIGTETDAHENFLNVAKAGDAAIDQIFALSGAIQAAADDDFTGTHGDSSAFQRHASSNACGCRWFLRPGFLQRRFPLALSIVVDEGSR